MTGRADVLVDLEATLQLGPVEGSEDPAERPVLCLDLHALARRHCRAGEAGGDPGGRRQRLDAFEHRTFYCRAAVAPAKPAPPQITGSLIDFGSCRGVSKIEGTGRIARKWMNDKAMAQGAATPFNRQ